MQNLPANTVTLNTTAIQNDRFRTPTRTRQRRTRTSLPPPDQRSWLLLTEAASLIGCSKATAIASAAAKSRVCLAYRPCRSPSANGSC